MNANSIITYKGRTPTGEKISGRFIGNHSDFKRKLQSQGILLLQVKEEKQKLKSGGFKETDFLSGIEQLYYLLNSGMRLDTPLETISDSLQKKSAQYFWITVLEEVKKGTRLSQAIAVGSSEVTGWQVPGLYSRMISIGEEVGEIGGSLKRLLHHMEFRKSMKAEIISSLSYPAFLVVMSVVAIAIVVLVIVPRFAAVFQPEQLTNLPLISKVVFSLGDIGSDQGKGILAFLSLFIVSVKG